jgi:hypothetical protein
MQTKLIGLLEKIDPSKEILIEKLLLKNWFKETRFDIQKKILELPNSYNGMLKELSNRPDYAGDKAILRLHDMVISQKMAILSFEVESKLNNEKMLREYVSYDTGVSLECNGIILIEEMGKIKYFVTTRTVDFVTGTLISKAIRMHYPKFNNPKLITLPKKIETQLKKMLEKRELEITRFVDLGEVYSDTTLTNNHSSTFAIIIKGDSVDLKNQTDGLEVESVEMTRSYINKIADSYLLAIFSKLMALNIIEINNHG